MRGLSPCAVGPAEPSRSVVWFVPQNGVGAVELLHEQDQRQAVRQCQPGQRQGFARPLLEVRVQPVGAADEERDPSSGPAFPFADAAGELDSRRLGAALIERHDMVAVLQLGGNRIAFLDERAIAYPEDLDAGVPQQALDVSIGRVEERVAGPAPYADDAVFEHRGSTGAIAGCCWGAQSNTRRVFPQRLQVVHLARELVEDVQHHAPEIDERPLTFTLAFHANRTHSLLAKGVLDEIGDRLHVAIARSRYDDQKVGVARPSSDVQDADVLRLAFEGQITNAAGQLFGIQCSLLDRRGVRPPEPDQGRAASYALVADL